MSAIPVIDLAQPGAAGGECHHGQGLCRNRSFFTVINHGVPAIADREGLCRRRNFFDLPMAKKMQARASAA